jgi:hypothetical protein
VTKRQDVATRPQTLAALDKNPARPAALRWFRIGVLIAGYILIIVFGHFAGRWLQHNLGLDVTNLDGTMARLVLGIGLLLFIAMLALPFVPGIEVSLALFAIFGTLAAVPIYLATVVALLLSYTAGRCVPLDRLAGFFDYIGLQPASALVRRLGTMTPRQRIEALMETAPNRISRVLVDHRDLALIAVLNMPGNALIGGGGGIALVAGMSGMFRPDRYLLAVAIAALPIPLFMLAGGYFMK